MNGTTGLAYLDLTLSGSVPPGGHYLVASSGLEAPPGVTVDMVLPAPHSYIQNAGPLAVAVYDPVHEIVIDAVSWDGSVLGASIDGGSFALVAGAPSSATDDLSAARSVVRYPDGADSGDDATDWRATSIPTPARW